MGKLILCIWIQIAAFLLVGCSEGDRSVTINEGNVCVVDNTQYYGDFYQIVGETEHHYIVLVWNGHRWKKKRLAIDKWKIDMAFDQIECLEE